jgi:hypothetical protein
MTITFRENDFVGEMNELRAKTITEISKGADMFNTGQITEKEYRYAKDILLDSAREQRANILHRRKEAIAEAELSITQKMANSEDVKGFRETYDQLMKMGKEELTNFYHTSLRLNDKVSARASALAASEKGLYSILNDYGRRDEEFVNHFKEKIALKERYSNPEKRMADQLGTYRSITPPTEKVEPVVAGEFLDQNAGVWRKYFKPKVTVKS